MSKYPEELTLSEADNFSYIKDFENFKKAEEHAKKVGGQVYTQIDNDYGDRVYVKGFRFVNRTGRYIVVKN